MHIIPVIDVRGGVAVRAVGGDRANYAPLTSPLVGPASALPWGQTHESAPSMTGPSVEAVARGYRSLYPFRTIYIADLDGIEGRGRNACLAPSLAAVLPDVEFWIDAGMRAPLTGQAEISVIGSETLGDADLQQTSKSAVLSLDFRGDRFVGPPALLDNPSLWPSRVIVMTLARVGADSGPDLNRIAEIARRAPHAQIYAAGGIRDVADLRSAEAAGAHGALIASALHAQKIKADDLDEIVGL